MPSILADLVVVGVSGALSKVLFAPLERVKLLLQVEKSLPHLTKPFSSAVDCFRQIIDLQGFRSLWWGVSIGCLRFLPVTLFRFYLSKYLPSETSKSSLVEKILIGGLGAISRSLVAAPIDTVYANMAADVAPRQSKYSGIVDCFAKLCRVEDRKLCLPVFS